MIGLTGADEKALLDLYKSSDTPETLVRIHSHYRFFRLREKGLVATCPPRLTQTGVQKATFLSQPEVKEQGMLTKKDLKLTIAALRYVGGPAYTAVAEKFEIQLKKFR